MNRKIGPGSGKFQPGNRANPGGRPKTHSLRQMILDATNDGADIVKMMLELANGKDVRIVNGVEITSERVSVAERTTAAKWLSDYGFGKPVEQVEVTGTLHIADAIREGRQRVHAALPGNN